MAAHTPSPTLSPLPFFAIRNITSPEDLENGRKVLAGQAPIEAVLELPTHENVRDYLLEAEGKKRIQPTQVHKAILETLRERPEDFTILNGGITIVARDHEIDEKNKVVQLLQPSIINGSQTQGVIRGFVAKCREDGVPVPPIHVKFELIITTDTDLIGDISIARNFQNDVMTVSIVGRKGQLDELEAALRKQLPDLKLRKSETKISRTLSLQEDYVFTEKLLQVITALTPDELWMGSGEPGTPNKAYTYSAKAKCLRDFQKVYVSAHDPKAEDHVRAAELYQFYLDIAAQAIELYERWKMHQGFAGTRLHSIKRNGTEIAEVPDGIVFPILAALAKFAKRTELGWRIVPPAQFEDGELIKAAKTTYQFTARSNPNAMGKNNACYVALYQLTGVYKRLMGSAAEN
jgi:hypothetical protein